MAHSATHASPYHSPVLHYSVNNLVCVSLLDPAAGEAFCLAADVQMKLDVKHEAGSNLVEAGQVFKREDPKSKRYKLHFNCHQSPLTIGTLICLEEELVC